MNETIKIIQNHRSIRKYLDKDIPQEVLVDILKAAQSMPTSINGQQVSIIVVKDKSRKDVISELSGGQPWISAAPVFLVFVADFYKTYLACEKNKTTQVIHESIEGTLVGTFDAGIAMGGTIVAAESLGLGIVPIGGIRNNPEKIIELLELPKYTYPIAGLVLGYPEDLSKEKPRLPFESFIHNESYDKENLKGHIDNYDDTMSKYYAERGDKQSNWSSQIAHAYKVVYFPKVYPTIKEQGFKNDK
ncbi:NADPH-dependent oxidoreductase [Clostridium sp. CX1]|uniref:NADPH-dependent oxidoreductase n=1 Tax=Clostridium sp. CX1 TaxID=2978346 RepID=UPI0021C09AA7|nr:NADPH-dependent oxidoreductase [Clostridium sp. CX1]MCT8975619.1 NADPH-dependent oxidoreductase [Clostridium sp. CX1]